MKNCKPKRKILHQFPLFTILLCMMGICLLNVQSLAGTVSTIGYFYSASGQMVDTEGNNGVMSSYLTRSMRYNGTDETFAVANIKDITALVDASGNVLNKYTYTAYGVPTSYSSTSINSKLNTQNSTLSLSSNPYTYSNYYTDSESGNYYLNARYYDPTIGIFLTSDSFNLSNRYMYVNGNPVMGIDSSGHFTLMILLAHLPGFSYCLGNHPIVQAYDRHEVDFWGRQLQGQVNPQVNPQVKNKENISFESIKEGSINKEKLNYVKATKDIYELILTMNKSLNTYQNMARNIRDFNATNNIESFQKLSQEINKKGLKMILDHDNRKGIFKLDQEKIKSASSNIVNSITQMNDAKNEQDLNTVETLNDYTCLLTIKVNFTKQIQALNTLNEKAISFYKKLQSNYAENEQQI